MDDIVKLALVMESRKGTTGAHNALYDLGSSGSKYRLEAVAKNMKAVKFLAPNRRDFIYKFRDGSTLYLFAEGDMGLVQDHDVTNLQEVDLNVWNVKR